MTNTTLMTLQEVENAYPAGVLSERHGCYYFLDQDDELGYFIKYIDGKFEPEPQYVDLDTLAANERDECERIAGYIAFNR